MPVIRKMVFYILIAMASFIVVFLVFVLSSPLIFLLLAVIGDLTGWYRLEDHMSMPT